MDLTCKFGIEYQPAGKTVDHVVEQHVANCTDCQGQVAFL